MYKKIVSAFGLIALVTISIFLLHDRPLPEKEYQPYLDSNDISASMEQPERQNIKEQTNLEDDVQEIQAALMAYNEFIDGKRAAGDEIDIDYISIPTGEPDKRYDTAYVILDTNGDGIPELNIKSARQFQVISYKHGELYILASFYSDPTSYTVLNDGSFMFYNYGRHGEDRWCYFQLDEDGTKINELNFSYTNEGDIRYYFDNLPYTKEKWYARARKYLYTGEDGREHILNEADWIIYCKSIR